MLAESNLETETRFITVVDSLNYRAKSNPDSVAVTFVHDDESEESLTYLELKLRAERISFLMFGLGLKKGDRVLLVFHPGLDYIASFYACLYTGIIAVPIYPPKNNYHMRRIESILKDVGTKHVLTTLQLSRKIQQFEEENPFFKNLKSIIIDGNPVIKNQESEQIESDDVAFIQYTSGSTDEPKGVLITQRNLLKNFEMIYKKSGIVDLISPLVVSWLPPYHDMGLIGTILQPIFYGYPTIQMSPISFIKKPILWIKMLSKFKSPITVAPNFSFDYCVENISLEDCRDFDLDSLEIVFSGAETVRPSTIDQFFEKFHSIGFKKTSFYPCYGLAEATLFVTGVEKGQDPVYFTREENGVSYTSCGKPYDSLELKVVDPQTKIKCSEEEIGEIWIQGENVSRGYYNKLLNSNQYFFGFTNLTEGPFFQTGDLGFLKDGNLFITGRMKEMIIIRGIKYFPQDLEFYIEKSHPAVNAGGSIAFFVGEGVKEQLILIVELTRHYKKYNFRDMIGYVRKSILEKFEIDADEIHFLKPNQIPRTSSGKKQRILTKRKFLNHEFNGLYFWTKTNLNEDHHFELAESKEFKRVVTSKNLELQVRNVLSKRLHLPPESISEETSLIQYGLDSLGLISFAGELEQVFQTNIEIDLIQKDPSLKNIIQYLKKIVRVDQIYSNHIEEKQQSVNGFDQNYKNGQMPNHEMNLDLKNLIPDLEGSSLLERVRTFNNKVSDTIGNLNIVYKREILSPIDREVLVFDPLTNSSKKMLLFGSNSYLGFANSSVLKEKLIRDLNQYGLGVGSAPLLSGYTKLHRELEEKISYLKNSEDTLLFSSGYNANVSLFSSILSPRSIFICDEFSHASTIDGLKLSGVQMTSFRHNDVFHLEEILKFYSEKKMELFVGVESLYSMDGDLSPLDEIQRLCEIYSAILIVDDAHGTGILGKKGFGVSEHFGKMKIDFTLTTFSKALAMTGGAISSTKEMINYLRLNERSYIFSTSLPITNVSMTLRALEMLENEPHHLQNLQKNIVYFQSQLSKTNLKFSKTNFSPIIIVHCPQNINVETAAIQFHKEGIFLNAVKFPAVPLGKERFRIGMMANHKFSDIDILVEKMVEILERNH